MNFNKGLFGKAFVLAGLFWLFVFFVPVHESQVVEFLFTFGVFGVALLTFVGCVYGSYLVLFHGNKFIPKADDL